MTTTLDHSSVGSLLNGLDRHRGGVFRFVYDGDDAIYPEWKLDDAIPVSGGRIRFVVEYGYMMPDGEWTPYPDTDKDILCWLDSRRGRLSHSDLADFTPMKVVLTEVPPCGGSVDVSQRNRLDKNLRGIFA